MKQILKSILLCVLICISYDMYSQSKTTTVIIVRHAEKDTSTHGSKMMSANPPLSEAGKARAVNLITAIKDFSPTAVFSTNYERTKATVEPLANKYGLTIQFYDPKNQQALAEQLKTMEGQTIVVAGHSNTVCKLVNLLAATNYPDLEDAVYNKIFIVKITNGNATVETKTY